MFVSECYELNQGDALYSKMMASFLGYEFPNGVKFNQSVELIHYMKQDGNWLPADLILPIISLELHVDFIIILNGM